MKSLIDVLRENNNPMKPNVDLDFLIKSKTMTFSVNGSANNTPVDLVHVIYRSNDL